MEGVVALFVMVFGAVIIGIAFLLTMYKTIDGEFSPLQGGVTMASLLFMLALMAKPPHPVLPAVILVVVISAMVLFPFAVERMDAADLREWDHGRLERYYETIEGMPSNWSARFEFAKAIHSMGLVHHAIAVTDATLTRLGDVVDEGSGRSLRYAFREEENCSRKWKRTAGSVPLITTQMRCSQCGHQNQLSAIHCEKCGARYILHLSAKGDTKKKVAGRLLMAEALIALTIVLASAGGLIDNNLVRTIAFVGGFSALAAILYWLFRPRTLQ